MTDRIPPYPDPFGTTYERRIMEPLKVGMTMASSVELDVDRDFMRDQLMHRLTAYVLADKLAEDTYEGRDSVEVPATTWQTFKAAHAASWWLGWLVRRRPVAMTRHELVATVHVGRYATYPEANYVLDDRLGRPVIFERASLASEWVR